MHQQISDMYRDHHARLIDDNSQYSKKVNIILSGMPIRHDYSNEDIRNAVIDEIERRNLEIDEIEVDRAHRHGQSYTDNCGRRQQNVICRFTTWSARDIFYQARKQSRFFVTADLTERR